MLDIKDKIRLQELAHKWLKGSLTVEEQQEFDLWFKQTHDNPLEIPEALGLDEESHERALFAKIQAELGIIPQLRTTKLWPRIIGIAAAVAAITLGVWLYYASNLNGRHPELVSGPPLANDIAPGGNKATIKIGNGEAIILSDKQTGVIVGTNNLTYTDGSKIAGRHPELVSGPPHSLMTVSTPRGGTYQVTLPDGTKVWLNAASVLTYTMPLNERGGIRKVQLSGEAYFEVFRNKNQPFVVTTKNLTTTVLGTHFNISAYDDENSAKATLLEGSVKVNDVILKPNQQASVTANSGISVKEVNAEYAVAWKQGFFMFNNDNLEDVMERIARWYNVDVEYDDPSVKKQLFFGTISKFENVSKVLNMLQRTNVVKFKIDGKKIVIIKNK